MWKGGAAMAAAAISIALASPDAAFAVESPRQASTTEIGEMANGPAADEAGAENPISGPYAGLITHYAKSFGVAPELADAVVRIESRYDPKARGRAGEIGLMQVKPSTARLMGYRGSVRGLYEPETNIRIGMKYLAEAQEAGDGTTCSTILKYNAGHGATRMNPISKHYCSLVLSALD